MIEWVKGDILDDYGKSLVVVPVNTRGVLGAGLARQFRTQFPNEARKYNEYCRKGYIQVNKITVSSGYRFVFFPTKDHWKDNSKIEWIENGLNELVECMSIDREWDVVSLPKLGAGLGKLAWEDVRPLLLSFDKTWQERIDEMNPRNIIVRTRVYGEPE